MSVTLTQGLSDLSRSLGESTVNQTTQRIGHYNDAIIEFFNERKWPFAVKLNSDLSSAAGDLDYDISSIEDRRLPGAVKEVTLGALDGVFTPINWADRFDSRYDSGKYIYEDPTQDTLYFKSDPGGAYAINIYYYHIPARIEDTASVLTFPLPTRYRKAVALLGAAHVQYSRYLTADGDKKMRLYKDLLQMITDQQSERNTGNPRKFGNPMRRWGFRRTYP